MTFVASIFSIANKYYNKTEIKILLYTNHIKINLILPAFPVRQQKMTHATPRLKEVLPKALYIFNKVELRFT